MAPIHMSKHRFSELFWNVVVCMEYFLQNHPWCFSTQINNS